MQSMPLPCVIDREQQIGEFAQRLDRMLAGSHVFDCVLFLHGVSSVGKTTLLEEMRREADRQSVPSALVDFDREQFADGRLVDNLYDGPKGRVQVVKRLMDDWARTARIELFRSIDTGLKPDEAADRLIDFVHDLAYDRQRRQFALFFDTIEDGDLDTFRWAQEHILQPLLQSFHVLVVIAGRMQPNTSQQDLIYPLERRTHKLHLRPFDSKQTDEQLTALGAEQIDLPREELTHYTRGLPGLNAAAAEWLRARRSEDQLLSYLVKEIIFQRLARQVDQRDLTAEVLAMSVLRQFDCTLLGRLMGDLWPDKYTATPGIRPMRRLVDSLQQSRLVESHPDGYGYTVPHDLRMVLDLYWQQCQPEKHLRVHHIAAQWFKEQVGQGDYLAIADRLYHLSGLWRDTDAHPDFVDRLKLELRTALDSLQKSGYRVYELATKIQNVLGQPAFKIVVAPHILDELVHICRAFIETLP